MDLKQYNIKCYTFEEDGKLMYEYKFTDSLGQEITVTSSGKPKWWPIGKVSHRE